MKIVYISHPVKPRVPENLESLRQILRDIMKTEPGIIPFAPYYLDQIAIEDATQVERTRGISFHTEFFARGCIDEVWLYGGEVSFAMRAEIDLAKECGILVIDKQNCLK